MHNRPNKRQILFIDHYRIVCLTSLEAKALLSIYEEYFKLYEKYFEKYISLVKEGKPPIVGNISDYTPTLTILIIQNLLEALRNIKRSQATFTTAISTQMLPRDNVHYYLFLLMRDNSIFNLNFPLLFDLISYRHKNKVPSIYSLIMHMYVTYNLIIDNKPNIITLNTIYFNHIQNDIYSISPIYKVRKELEEALNYKSNFLNWDDCLFACLGGSLGWLLGYVDPEVSLYKFTFIGAIMGYSISSVNGPKNKELNPHLKMILYANIGAIGGALLTHTLNQQLKLDIPIAFVSIISALTSAQWVKGLKISGIAKMISLVS